MSSSEAILLYAALGLYLAAFASLFLREAARPPFLLLCLGLGCHLASAGVRWAAIGHPPVFGTYEAALQGSWFLALCIAFSYRSLYGHFRGMAATALPLVALMLLYGLFFNTERIPLTISERSLWVDFHALFSWLAFAPFTLAFCLSAVLLIKEGRGGEGKGGGRPGSSPWPPFEIMDELAFRYVNFGFINHTVMFALGCYYSSILYGTWWQWDPAESTSLIAWLSVALYIHMRLFFNWKMRKAAWLYAALFTAILFSYWGLIYLPAGSTFHIFDIEFKAH